MSGIDVFTAIAVMFGLILLAGLVAGQFRRGVVGELRDTLNTAKSEIEIERSRSDRLEKEAGALRAEVAGLRAEVHTLRSVLTDDRKLAQTVAEALRLEDEVRSVHLVDELKEAMGMYTARIIEHHEVATTNAMRTVAENAVKHALAAAVAAQKKPTTYTRTKGNPIQKEET